MGTLCMLQIHNRCQLVSELKMEKYINTVYRHTAQEKYQWESEAVEVGFGRETRKIIGGN